MKRKFYSFGVLLVLLFLIIGCNSQKVTVSIHTDKDSFNFDAKKSSYQGFNLTPELSGHTTDSIQYRWSTTEGDYIVKGDHYKEVVNNGEPLLWSSTLIWSPSWNGSSSTYEIKVKVEDVKTSKTLAETTLTIERNGQLFKVKG